MSTSFSESNLNLNFMMNGVKSALSKMKSIFLGGFVASSSSSTGKSNFNQIDAMSMNFNLPKHTPTGDIEDSYLA